MHIHILGIAGVMTAPLAVELQRLGYTITGTDQKNIYPPISTLLDDAKIKINDTPITSDINLAIIGSSFKSFEQCRYEFEQIKALKIPYISATQYLANHLIKKNSILVAGSFGKTTISALIVWILKTNNSNPNYFFGGKTIESIPSLKITESDWSVTEADESINGLDTMAKFLYYPSKYVVLTSASWEHRESYPSKKDNLNAFKKLITQIPTDGALIYNPHDSTIKKILSSCTAKIIPYNESIRYQTPLIGEFNQQNVQAAATLAQVLNISPDDISRAISSFHGIKRRLEIIKKVNNTYFIDDFAQSADRITQVITTLHTTFPHHTLKVFFEPHASFLQYKASLNDFKSAFKEVDDIVLSTLKFNSNQDKATRVTAKDFVEIIGPKLHYQPTLTETIDYYQHNLSDNTVLIHFSSGGLSGLNTLNQIITNYESKV